MPPPCLSLALRRARAPTYPLPLGLSLPLPLPLQQPRLRSCCLSHVASEPSPTPAIVAPSARHEARSASRVPPGVTVVADRAAAAAAVHTLLQLPPTHPVAWDTETHGIDPTKQSPVAHGNVICATAFAGSAVDFGKGPRLFVDVLDGEPGLLAVFKPYFESRNCPKVWHHYAFDRHMLWNHGIVAQGFMADTMHMARLHNSALPRYSLAALCAVHLDGSQGKTSIMHRFGAPRLLKNGKLAKVSVIPSTLELQRGVHSRYDWVDYATLDAELTHRLFCTLSSKLAATPVDASNSLEALVNRFPNLMHLYREVMRPFGELLTDMEREGFKVDVDFLRHAEVQAESDRLALENRFLQWAETRCPDARYMNINSDQQKLQLFFAPCNNSKDKAKKLPASKSFTFEVSGACRQKYLDDLAKSEKKEHQILLKQLTEPDKQGKVKKAKVDIVIKGLKKTPQGRNESGWPSVSSSALRKLAGNPRADPPKYGEPDDPDMCKAVDHMVEATTIGTLINTFIAPLQQWPGGDGRIHASLNLNTETGRLSSRRPNLQNQPALEKDRYQVRKAFACEEGSKLIVADYGQLELRILAHITKCRSMIDAFRAGGDFHSRTAMTMFENVRQSVEKGECVLERKEGDISQKNVPLVKDTFSVERRKAKTLNFSIAYGKTVKGFAKDWNVSEEEARDTVRLWYKERQEVSEWQRRCRLLLREKGYVETLLGRRRHLPDIEDMRKRAHAERAAINAPIQGSAADLVMLAMVKMHQNAQLRILGWRIILQVHDEIILEGPAASADVALPIIVENMRKPIDFPLLVDLTVDAKISNSWFEAK